MPPKGWRKDQDANFVSTKERDQISIDDILFPKATVNKLAKAILLEGSLVTKDSSIVIQRSATVFVSYLLVHARASAKQYNRKTVGPQDIINALEAAEFSSFIPAVREELDQYQATKDAQKQRRKEEKEKAQKANQSAAATVTTTTTTATTTSPSTAITTTSIDADATKESNGNETVDDDSFATTNEEENVEPQTKKIKNGSREDTISEAEN